MTEMKGNFYSNFTSNLGFAILAFYDKKLVYYWIQVNSIIYNPSNGSQGRGRVLPAGGGQEAVCADYRDPLQAPEVTLTCLTSDNDGLMMQEGGGGHPHVQGHHRGQGPGAELCVRLCEG